MNVTIKPFLIIIFGFLLLKSYSQENLYLLLDTKDDIFIQNIDSVNELSNGKKNKRFYFNYRKNKIKFKSLSEEIKYTAKWAGNDLSFFHNETDSIILFDNKLKNKLNDKLNNVLSSSKVGLSMVDNISLDSIYNYYLARAKEEDSILKANYMFGMKYSTSKMKAIYNEEFKHFYFKKTKNKPKVDLIKIKKFSCYEKFKKLETRLKLANKVYIVYKDKNKNFSIFEVVSINKRIIE